MNALVKIPFRSMRMLVMGLGVVIIAACSPSASQEKQSIRIDGSSTVYPITNAIVDKYKASAKAPTDINVAFSGTGGGFEKFCRGETDINNASRPIQVKEMKACDQAKIRYIELPVAFDALTVVVNPKNDWLKSITIEELKKIWSPKAQNKITRWNQIRPDLPDKPLNLFGPGADSGTFDYFTEAVVGEAGTSRTDYVASEDDNILVQGVSQDPNALGYFGLAYYQQRANQMKAIAIDSGSGAIMPDQETVEKGEYQPLARPLFIYINATSAQKNSSLRKFLDYYLEQVPEVVKGVGYVPLPQEAYHIRKVAFHKGKAGTVFDGKSEFNLTIPELLRKQAKF